MERLRGVPSVDFLITEQRYSLDREGWAVWVVLRARFITGEVCLVLDGEETLPG